jgi:demethylmenaquinone methyltransferase/2-methoxy-6-polyprenyl-1,4-benzoquinol methylase
MRNTHFGYQTVKEDAKAGLVREVFSSVAGRYDLMNDLMSAGAHRLWKDAMVEWLNPHPGQQFVDVAGGTGDIAFRIASTLRKQGKRPGLIAICDINEDMLREGIARRVAAVPGSLSWISGDAANLPFGNARFDGYTIAFGIRNVTQMEAALAEAFRVLKPGGRFICLEFSRVEAPGLDALYDAYSFAVLPRLGRLVAGDEVAYRYLVESIRRFPSQNAFARKIRNAGFARVKIRNLSGGIAALHSAWKL